MDLWKVPAAASAAEWFSIAVLSTAMEKLFISVISVPLVPLTAGRAVKFTN
jgi:hypothetical protein